MSDSELEWLERDVTQMMDKDGPGAKTQPLFQVTHPSLFVSVADPGYLSRILIFIHPGSRIQKQLQKRGVKK